MSRVPETPMSFKSKYVAPPEALDANGKAIVYTSTVGLMEFDEDRDGYLQAQFDLILPGGCRCHKWVSVQPFMDRTTGEITDRSPATAFFKKAGVTAEPSNEAQYKAAFQAAVGKPVRHTIDWQANDKATGQKVEGYASFPPDPSDPTRKKPILRAADNDLYYVNGEPFQVQAEVLFANARFGKWAQ